MEEKNTDRVDIFHWANQADSAKHRLQVELFLFNKHYTPFHARVDSDLEAQLKPLFLFEPMNTVMMGAGTGLMVRDYESSEAEENVLLRTNVANVERAAALLNMIEHERSGVVEFSEVEHEMKRMKGVLARFTDPEDSTRVFYSAKLLQPSSILKDVSAWQFSGSSFESFEPEVGFKMPSESHALIVDGEIFVFNQSKFVRLFQYDYKKQLLADKKVAAIEQQYRLSFPEGVDLQSLVRERTKIVNKLQKLEVGEVSQEQALDYADEMGLELMTDNDNSIIIMDGNDLDVFVGLINEDFVTSKLTGKRYEIKSKKLLGEASGGEPPRG